MYTPVAKILFSYYLTHISRFYSGLKECSYLFFFFSCSYMYISSKKNSVAQALIKLFGKNAYNGLLIQKKSLRLSYVRLCTRLSP